ncbi:glycosyltransferase [uncultured Rikenella sp.]|uniref:glycosyltransferase family 2 protein n=1 Tax=uncultured Rikenella sp. TaxID=368003 RepID=UPI00272B13BD|nr:glycosyltransferase [uncultured Rikenella sp.]
MVHYSILISVYHREQPEFLETALSSVFDQTVLPDEVVLVKDGPLTPGLDAVISRYAALHPELHVITLPENVGLGAALNEGLKHCSYDLVARMDSDDICVNDRFERQLNIFSQHPECDIVGGWIDEFSNDPHCPEAVRQLPETHEEIGRFFRIRSPVNHVTVMFRRSAVLAAGGYQPFYLLEDYWLWGRMLHNGARFYNIPAILVHVRGGNAMAARRGGWKYAVSEVKLQRAFLRLGLIGYGTFCTNVIMRFTVRIMPNRLRTFVYQKLLRK